MNAFQVSILAASVINAVLGLTVYLMNRRRPANRFFLLTTIACAAWLSGLGLGSFAADREVVLMWIRHAGVSALWLPVTFDLLCLAVVRPDLEPADVWRRARLWLALLPPVMVLCYGRAFVLDAVIDATGYPQPVHGSGQFVYIGFWFFAIGVVVVRAQRDLRRAIGMEREELLFAFLGAVSALVAGLALAQLIPMTTGRTDVSRFTPLVAVLFFDVTMSYGIATRKIMNVSDVLRRATAYTLLAGYLALVYLVVRFAGRAALRLFRPEPGGAPDLLAALTVAFSVAPAHGHLQRFANRLFISMEMMDVGATVREAQTAIQSIGTVSDLLRRFAGFLARAAGTDRVLILLRQNGRFRQAYPAPESGPAAEVDADGGLARGLGNGGPFALDVMRRREPTSELTRAGTELQRLGAHVAVAIRAKGEAIGLLLLGRRLSGKIYGRTEQDALQVMCNQLGVALENARLYTELRDSKTYDEILLDSLTSGIVAVNADRRITVFNRQAEEVTGLSAAGLTGGDCGLLPEPIRTAVRETLEGGDEVRDRDAGVGNPSRGTVPVRLSTSAVRDHRGTRMGALAVFNDMTEIRKLEEKMRRTDRLSSLGTLAAGMAHEIKNPLVSIKTFTQLLPEQYRDEEFRQTFFELIGSEVRRIDSIVNRLLHFARPPEAELVPVRLHSVLADALRLVEQQLKTRGIGLRTDFAAGDPLVYGDRGLLNQAFINLFLNAIEAMDGGGQLSVITEPGGSSVSGPRSNAGTVRVTVRDTGCGMTPETVRRMFDPFFTTKSDGTGMGLSVAHGIMQEHEASLDVESEVGVGSAFHATFPLARG